LSRYFCIPSPPRRSSHSYMPVMWNGGCEDGNCRIGCANACANMNARSGLPLVESMREPPFDTFPRVCAAISSAISALTSFAKYAGHFNINPYNFKSYNMCFSCSSEFHVYTTDIIIFVQVPLFKQMDDQVLNNICERLKPRIFIKNETVSSNRVQQLWNH